MFNFLKQLHKIDKVEKEECKIMVESVKADIYLTSDGKKFLHKREANEHEATLMVEQLFKLLNPDLSNEHMDYERYKKAEEYRKGYRHALRNVIDKFGMPKKDIKSFL